MNIYKNEKLIMEGKKEDGLYMFDIDNTDTILLASNAPKNQREKLQRAHTRLGHRNLLLIKKYVKNKLIKLNDFPSQVTDEEIKSLPLCDACQRAKFTSMRIRGRGERAAAKIGQKMVTDMKGPIRVKGLNGQAYYQGFMDVRSKYLYMKCFERKSAAPANLREIMALPLYKNHLQQYHSDGAPELISKEIVRDLKEQGIVNTYSAPYKHTDNSIIERSHRTIFEMAHAMLLYSTMSVTFWCEAVAHAVYLYNRMPTQTGEGYMAPITAAFNINADLSNEHIFGCICYFIVPPETREKGFVDKANKGIYLGHRAHGSPGYTIFHIALNKIIFSSDVTFDESDVHDRSKVAAAEEADGLFVDAVSRHPDDFKWLEGMAYKDDNQLYLTTRVLAQQGWVVAYRALAVDNNVGVEETRPLHAADVEKLVKIYTSFNDVHLSLGGAEGLHRISKEHLGEADGPQKTKEHLGEADGPQKTKESDGGEEIAGPVVQLLRSGREGRSEYG